MTISIGNSKAREVGGVWVVDEFCDGIWERLHLHCKDVSLRWSLYLSGGCLLLTVSSTQVEVCSGDGVLDVQSAAISHRASQDFQST